MTDAERIEKITVLEGILAQEGLSLAYDTGEPMGGWHEMDDDTFGLFIEALTCYRDKLTAELESNA